MKLEQFNTDDLTLVLRQYNIYFGGNNYLIHLLASESSRLELIEFINKELNNPNVDYFEYCFGSEYDFFNTKLIIDWKNKFKGEIYFSVNPNIAHDADGKGLTFEAEAYKKVELFQKTLDIIFSNI